MTRCTSCGGQTAAVAAGTCLGPCAEIDEVLRWERRVAVACGRWEHQLAGAWECDAVITDPPYGGRTHAGFARQKSSDGSLRETEIRYESWEPADVRAFVAAWAPRCRGWFVAMTSHDLIPVWMDAYEAAGRYAFAPVWVVQPLVRLVGDGPASPGVYVMVSRPSSQEFSRWGALRGSYKAPQQRVGLAGSKPTSLLRELVRDYTRPGDLIVDPCAGHGSTLRAAVLESRRAIGCEMDPARWAVCRGDGLPGEDGQIALPLG